MKLQKLKVLQQFCSGYFKYKSACILVKDDECETAAEIYEFGMKNAPNFVNSIISSKSGQPVIILLLSSKVIEKGYLSLGDISSGRFWYYHQQESL
jgi:hypothetical protein